MSNGYVGAKSRLADAGSYSRKQLDDPDFFSEFRLSSASGAAQTVQEMADFRQIVAGPGIDALRSIEPTRDGQGAFLLGYSVFGLGGGRWYYDASDTTSADDDALVIVTTNGARWKKEVKNNTVSLSEFGITSSTSASENKSRAVKALATTYNVLFDFESLDFGAMTDGEILFNLGASRSGKTISGDCRVVVQGPAMVGEECYIFVPDGGTRFRIEGLTGVDTANNYNDDSTPQRSGASFFYGLSGTPSSERGRLIDVRMEGGVSLFSIRSSDHDDYEVQGSTDGAYYGLNTAAGGNGLRAHIECVRVRRAFFPYNCRNQRVKAIVKDARPASGCILIKSYNDTTPTENIEVDVEYETDQASGNGIVTIEHEDAYLSNSIIRDIRVRVHDRSNYSGLPSYPLEISYFNDDGTNRPTAKTIGISLSGRAAIRPACVSDPVTPVVIDISDGFFVDGELSDGSMRGSVVRDNLSAFENITYKIGPRTFQKVAVADNTGVAAARVPLAAIFGPGNVLSTNISARVYQDTRETSASGVYTVLNGLSINYITGAGSMSADSSEVSRHDINGGVSYVFSSSSEDYGIYSADLTPDYGAIWVNVQVQ